METLDLLAAAAKLLTLGPHEACGCKECSPFVKERRELQKDISDYFAALRATEETKA
jgi:hypothetical protein